MNPFSPTPPQTKLFFFLPPPPPSTRSALFRGYKEKLKKPNFCAGFEFLSEQKGLFSLRRAETNFWNKDYSLFEQKKKEEQNKQNAKKTTEVFSENGEKQNQKKTFDPTWL